MNVPIGESIASKRLFVQMLLSMVAYVAVLVVSIWLLKTHDFAPSLRVPLALAPVVPVVAVLASLVRFVLSVDELQRQIHLEALAISAVVTAALAITYTFLEGIGFPHSQAYWAFDALIAGWALALPFIRKRYE